MYRPWIFLCGILSILTHKHTHCHKHKTVTQTLSRLPVRHRSASQCLHRSLSPPRHGLSTYHILSAKAGRTQSWLPRLLRTCLHRGFRRQHRCTRSRPWPAWWARMEVWKVLGRIPTSFDIPFGALDALFGCADLFFGALEALWGCAYPSFGALEALGCADIFFRSCST